MPLPKWELATSDVAICTSCWSRNTVKLFPAALARNSATRAESALDGEAACFDHPSKRAVAACAQCGRFVCQLCAVEFGAAVWCPSCVASSAGKAKVASAETSRTLYDTWALVTPFALLVVWPLTLLSAPAVVALAIMKWKQPISLIRRNRWRFLMGLLVALAQGGLWLWGIWYAVAKIRSG
jgi:hypothetical protein